MNQMTGRAIGSFPTHDGRARRNFILRLGEPGYVIVDRDGRRFADEHEQAILTHTFYFDLLHFDGRRGRYPRIPSYWIFDERRRRAGPLTVSDLGLSAVGLYDWSDDNSVEIDAGWIHHGATAEEVARAAGVEDPEAAAATVEAYNRACTSGEADPFGRPPATMVPLDRPPFYCVPLWPGGANTSGGPRRDGKAQVLDPEDRPIPGLFAAGELGQAIGLRYPADGANLSEALCFGRIAARTALEG